ncbi:hypothetical protein A1Q1_05746 [Trichosporon asahii var. asahii CBS 2479]|uniref:Uncharacterized protein n=1 Tax=Trichosporon asahii var. asahii (strain ATCC 90039 / CBS 2479 / JCM 2466 / KCTC 7840 / NBRC 103889/ NCYC 2677 / UAMH 7654) TaxID=1186058 RepID=J5Q746_TRIAS|nr:hypothetical protein A1Q1_05746 [Trichosporon asahii var. asahii CBS 2479]EJT45833.1 hypothetical protein A1Q1_05746 [Trichosporon asahii var. asahii CBS 2479]
MPPVASPRVSHSNARSNVAPYQASPHKISDASPEGSGQRFVKPQGDKHTNNKAASAIDESPARNILTHIESGPGSALLLRLKEVERELPFPPVSQPPGTLRPDSRCFIGLKVNDISALVRWRHGQWAISSINARRAHISKTPAAALADCSQALFDAEARASKTSPQTAPEAGSSSVPTVSNTALVPRAPSTPSTATSALGSIATSQFNNVLFTVPDGVKEITLGLFIALVMQHNARRDDDFVQAYKSKRASFKLWLEQINAAIERGDVGFLDAQLDAGERDKQQKKWEGTAARPTCT